MLLNLLLHHKLIFYTIYFLEFSISNNLLINIIFKINYLLILIKQAPPIFPFRVPPYLIRIEGSIYTFFVK